jgi:uncharacterized coiled-coil protein SlyX
MFLLPAFIGAALLCGCAEDTTDLKQRIAELEKRVVNQEKSFADLSGKVTVSKDFSADIQRLDDQQEKIAQVLKTKVDPINMKLEEFREWAQEAQAERGKVAGQLKGIEQAVAELQKRLEKESRAIARVGQDLTGQKQSIAGTAKALEDLSTAVAKVQKEAVDSNTRLVEAVKKTLPKVKSAAVDEIKDRLVPLEKTLTDLRVGFETERRTVQAIPSTDGGRDMQAVKKKVTELEEVLASQQSYLLEMGGKIHELEAIIKGGSAAFRPESSSLSRR